MEVLRLEPVVPVSRLVGLESQSAAQVSRSEVPELLLVARVSRLEVPALRLAALELQSVGLVWALAARVSRLVALASRSAAPG